MGDVVGSYEINPYWHTRWARIKATVHLMSEQRTVITGSLLGDGTMRVGRGSINANFKIEHGLQQKAYVEWKHNLLKRLVFTGPRLSYRYSESGMKYAKSWWFRTIRHPVLTQIYRQFYAGEGFRCGKKVVPQSVKQDLTPLALAIWVMDDGSYSKGAINLSTYAFSVRDIYFLKECLQEKFRVETTPTRDRDKGYRLFCTRASTANLARIIRPYIIPSMRYKIGLVTP